MYGGSGREAAIPSWVAATGNRWLESVVRTNRLGALARIPCSRMSSATVFSEHSCPRAFNSAVMRGLP